jgi:hypothetical protein
MFLMLMVVVVFAALSREYSRVMRRTNNRAQTMQAAATGLELLARELRGAQAISVPVLRGQTASALNFTVVDVNQPDRLFPAPNPDPPRLPILDLNAANRMQHVDYAVADGGLRRRVANNAQLIISDQVVSEGVNGFNCTWRTDHSAELRVSVQEDNLLRTLSHRVLLLEGF